MRDWKAGSKVLTRFVVRNMIPEYISQERKLVTMKVLTLIVFERSEKDRDELVSFKLMERSLF